MCIRKSKSAFTLVELLVVIGIIALLISILLPALSRARLQARRTLDLSNIRQVAIASVSYAAENKGSWPVGSRLGADPTAIGNPGDDIVWINYYTFGYFLNFMTSRSTYASWMKGATLEPSLKRVLACESMQNGGDSLLSIVGEQAYQNYETFMGFIFWPRRSNAIGGAVYDNTGTLVTPALTYVFPQKQGGPATSQTLCTCYCYAGPSYGCDLPHFKTAEAFSTGPACNGPNVTYTLAMQGMCIAYLDGSAKWVPRKQLWSMKEGGFEWVYFDKTRP